MKGKKINMKTYRTEAIIYDDKTLIVKKLPFHAGDKVEVIVRCRKRELKRGERYPLRGKPIYYVEPFKSIAEEDWSVLK